MSDATGLNVDKSAVHMRSIIAVIQHRAELQALSRLSEDLNLYSL